MRNERGGRVALSLAALLLMVGLSGCLTIERTGSDSAPTWGSTPPTDLPSNFKVVTNPTSPAAYYCYGIQNSGPLNFQLVPWSCAAHFQGQGIAVSIPADCYDVLRDGR